jgi:hypothetical protein
MTPKQNALYWRSWAGVRAACPGADRHDLHRKALGHDCGHADFTNEDFDRVLAAFAAVARPDDLEAQLRQLEQPRRRMEWAIAQLCAPHYRAAVMMDRWGHADLAQLTLEELGELRMTLARASRRTARRAAAMANTEAADPF